MISTQQIRGFVLLFALILISSSALAQKISTAETDSTNIDKVIMERVTVVGTPVWMTKIPGAASYISAEQLQKHDYTDINRVLRGVSGVNIQEEDGFGLRPNIGMRGAGVERSTKVNIMEDGVLIAPAPYSAPAAYYFPMVNRMSSVEIRKGSSQIKYGPNTTGGAINLISTPIPSELSGNAEFSLGENRANKIHANVGNTYDNFGFLLEGLQMKNDGFKRLDGGGNTGYDIQDFVAKFMVRTNPNASTYQRVDFKVGFYDEISDETYLGLTRDDFDENPFRRYAASQEDQMRAKHFQMMMRHFAQFSSSVDLTTTLYRNNFARDWYKLQSVNGTGPAGVVRNPDDNFAAMNVLRGGNSADDALVVRSNSREYYSQGIESILAYYTSIGSAENELQLGIRLHQDEEDRFQFEDGYRMEEGNMILTSKGVPGTQANRVGSATALAIYAQNTITYNQFTFTPGLRYENIWFENLNYGTNDLERIGSEISVNKYTVIIPGIGITYEVNDALTLISGIHKGFSPPSPGSSEETRSESSVNYELGFRYANNTFQFETIGFYSDYSNLLGSDLAAGGGSGTTAQFNAGEVEVLGLEVSANTDLAPFIGAESYSLPFSMNYTLTDATFQSDFDSSFGPWGTVQSGDELPFIPNQQLNASLGLDYNKLSLNLNGTSTSKMRTSAGQGEILSEESTDSYFLLDANTSYQIAETINIFVNLRNVLNETYIVSDRPHGIRPGLPRTLMGGIKVNL